MANYTGVLDENLMEEPELIKTSSRSDSAKKMWVRRKAEQTQKENAMAINSPIKAWVYHTEWATLMATVVGLFLFVHHENVHLTGRLDTSTQRLDAHIEQINRRVDESNSQLNNRCDELHKEFYDLLKETRRPPQL